MNTDFHFVNPAWLWLVLLGPLALAGLHWAAARGRAAQLAQLCSPRLAAQLAASHSPGRRQAKEWLLVASLALAGVALARPQWGGSETATTWVGEDLVFAMDCSLSMATTDVTPNRLQRAKFAVLDFVRRQAHGRVGLVAFAGSAFTQCPLTFDLDAFEESLDALNTQVMPVAGTDIGRALREAYQAMDKASRHKVIVLVTDGEDLEKEGVNVAKSLATNGVVIFTVGVGTAAGKDIQIQNAAGQADFVRDAQGGLVRSRLDEDTLREIAEATGGSYFPLGPAGEGLTRVRTSMQVLEAARAAQNARRNGVDRFFWPLALALAVWTVEPLIGTRRRAPGRNA